MKKFMLGAAATALLAGPVIAQSGAGGARAGLDRAQVAARVQAAFVRVDANRDGFVTQAEAQANRAAVRGDRAERREARFARLDVNRDGAISRAEFLQPRARAGGDRAERREDRAERRELRAERRAERRQNRLAKRGNRGFGGRLFTRMDANRDGRVSLAEATALRLQRFDRIDANRDGRITPGERQALRGSRG